MFAVGIEWQSSSYILVSRCILGTSFFALLTLYSRILSKWFTGHALALSLCFNLLLMRLSSAVTLIITPVMSIHPEFYCDVRSSVNSEKKGIIVATWIGLVLCIGSCLITLLAWILDSLWFCDDCTDNHHSKRYSYFKSNEFQTFVMHISDSHGYLCSSDINTSNGLILPSPSRNMDDNRPSNIPKRPSSSFFKNSYQVILNDSEIPLTDSPCNQSDDDYFIPPIFNNFAREIEKPKMMGIQAIETSSGKA